MMTTEKKKSRLPSRLDRDPQSSKKATSTDGSDFAKGQSLEMPDPVRPTYVHVHFTPTGTGIFYLLAK